MPIFSSEASENEGLLQAARLMLVSARTAPKSGGIDDVLTAIVLGKEKESLADEMDKIAEERKIGLQTRCEERERFSGRCTHWSAERRVSI